MSNGPGDARRPYDANLPLGAKRIARTDPLLKDAADDRHYMDEKNNTLPARFTDKC